MGVTHAHEIPLSRETNQIERSNISMNPSAGARGCPVANSAPAAGYAERSPAELPLADRQRRAYSVST